MLSTEIRYYDFENYRLDVVNRKLFRDDKVVSIPPKCFEILLFLIENKQRAVSKEELLDKFWEEDYVEEKNLVQHLYKVRKIIKYDNTDFIETIPKFGYQFIGDVKTTLNDSAVERLSNLAKANYDLNPHKSLHFLDNGKINQTELKEKQENELEKSNSSDKLSSHNYKQNNIIFNNRFILACLATLAILLPIGGYLYYSKINNKNLQNIQSIAVLPFKQIGSESDEKLGLGMADTLISQLSKQKKISVSPTSTIIRLTDNNNENPIDVGKKLNVDAVLTGTIQRDGSTVRVNAQLIDVNSETSLWSDKFDEEFSNIFNLQDKITKQIAHKLSFDIKTNSDSQNTKDIEAYQAYTMGLFYWNKRTSEDLQKAAEYFHTAIEKDSEFATAYAYLADSYALLGHFNLVSKPKEATAKAKKISEKALQFNPESSEAFCALGLILQSQQEISKAHSFYKKAIELNPNNATAHQRLAYLFSLTGELDKAIDEIKIAQKMDPLSFSINSGLAYYFTLARKPKEALKFSQRAGNFISSYGQRVSIIRIYEQLGEYEKAISKLKKLRKDFPKETEPILLLSRNYAKNEEMQKAKKTMDEFLSKEVKLELSYDVALTSIYLNEPDTALNILKQIKFLPSYLLSLENDYNLDPIRNTEEFKKLVAAVKSEINEKS